MTSISTMEPTITAQSVRDVEFRESFRGYNAVEVDEFLEKVAADLELLHARVRELTESARSESKAVDAAANDESVRRTLVLAQRAADLVVSEAKSVATKVIAEAEDKAAAIRTDASAEAERIRAEAKEKADIRLREAWEEGDAHLEDVKARASQHLVDAEAKAQSDRTRFLGDAEHRLEEASVQAAGMLSAAQMESDKLRSTTEAEVRAQTAAATDEAESIRRAATIEADRVLSDAAVRAEQLRQDAERTAQEMRVDAERAAAALRVEAEREAKHTTTSSQIEAARVLAEKEAEAARVLREAQEAAQETARRVDHEHKALRETVENLQTKRAELHEQLRLVLTGHSQWLEAHGHPAPYNAPVRDGAAHQVASANVSQIGRVEGVAAAISDDRAHEPQSMSDATLRDTPTSTETPKPQQFGVAPEVSETPARVDEGANGLLSRLRPMAPQAEAGPAASGNGRGAFNGEHEPPVWKG